MKPNDQHPLHEGVYYLSEESAYQHISEYALMDVEVVKDSRLNVPVFKVVKI